MKGENSHKKSENVIIHLTTSSILIYRNEYICWFCDLICLGFNLEGLAQALCEKQRW